MEQGHRVIPVEPVKPGEPVDPMLVVLAAGMSSRMKQAAAGDGVDGELLRDAREKAKAMIRVGPGGTPFLDFCLSNFAAAGYREIVIVTGQRDTSITNYYEKEGHAREWGSLSLSYVVQRIPAGREKPLGTADALLGVLAARPAWRGRKFTVCNSDNLYSVDALKLLLGDPHRNALIDYDRDALGFPPERTSQFAVITLDGSGFVKDIVEKPAPGDIAAATGADGRVRVSMNIFRLSYDDILPRLEAVPLHPLRNEKELPVAVRMLASGVPGSVYAIPLTERVPDLTQVGDIPEVLNYLKTMNNRP
jgi:UTP-glucose-1-phosphate uridylyltransferase